MAKKENIQNQSEFDLKKQKKYFQLQLMYKQYINGLAVEFITLLLVDIVHHVFLIFSSHRAITMI